MNRILAVAALVVTMLAVSCTVHKVTDPALNKPQASGTPFEDEGGGDPPPGGGTQYAYVSVPATATLFSTVTIPVSVANVYASPTEGGVHGIACYVKCSPGLHFTNLAVASGAGNFYLCSFETNPLFGAFDFGGGIIQLASSFIGSHCGTCHSGDVFYVTIAANASHQATEYVYLVPADPSWPTPGPFLMSCNNYPYGPAVTYGTATCVVTVN